MIQTLRRLAFGVFPAGGATGGNIAVQMNFDIVDRQMFWTAGVQDLIFRCGSPAPLGVLLKQSFGIQCGQQRTRVGELLSGQSEYEVAHHIESGVQVERSQHRFEQVGQCGIPVGTAGVAFSATGPQIVAEPQFAGEPGERRFPDLFINL